MLDQPGQYRLEGEAVQRILGCGSVMLLNDKGWSSVTIP